MADYYQLKNQNIFNPPANTSLGNATNQFDDVYVQNELVLGNTAVTGATINTPKVSTITYPGDDTAADPAGGQTITLTGSGFLVGATVLINNIEVGVVSVVNSTTITFTSPANSTGSYVLYVINTDGGTAIAIPGIQYSGTPTWTTAAGSLGSLYETASFNSTVTATGDAPITYSVASGTLPPGATFNSNGTITGTSELLASPTTYTFTVRATDAELQDTNRTFSLTINPDVVTWVSPANGTTYTTTANSAISNVTLSATSAVGSGITYSANALPDGISLSGNTISGTPTVAANSSSLLTATANTTSESSNITINWTVSVANDIYFEYNTLLIPGASTTFVDDASTNNFAVTINGDTKPNSMNPYSSGYYSNYFDGSGDYLTFPTSSGKLDCTGDFTLEMWIYWVSMPTTGYDNIYGNNATGSYILGTSNSSTVWAPPYILRLYQGGLGTLIDGNTVLTAGNWYHIAWTRSSGLNRLFVNGLLQTNTYSDSTSRSFGSSGVNLANNSNCYVSNFRFLQGTALYTTTFTPSASPLTAIANTQLLTCQSNRFIDNSTNNFTITVAGNTTVNSFDPFVPNSSYSTYGSGYFDGTGDWLTGSTSSENQLTGNFTIECWAYPTTIGGQMGLVSLTNTSSSGSNGLALYFDTSNKISFWVNGNGGTATTTTAYTANQWYHIALVRSGSTNTLYVNGVSSASNSTTPTWPTTPTIGIGRLYNDSTSYLMTGYMSNVRIVKGTAVYTTAFTPPSEPLTAIANTSLLTLQNNQSVNNNVFLDNSTNNFLVTRAGNTTQGTFSPYGGNWSNYFGGQMASALSPSSTNFNLTGDFTLEAYVFLTALPGGDWGILDARTAGASAVPWLYSIGGNGKINFYDGAARNGATTVTLNTWHHVAWVRNGSVLRGYLDGVLDYYNGSYGTSAISPGSTAPVIGTKDYTINAYGTTGYISNLRVVNGTAVYTTSSTTVGTTIFTPSTTPLTPITNTVLLSCADSRFIDDSVNNYTITPSSSTISAQRFSPFSPSTVTPTSYSGYFDGTGDYLSVPASTSFAFGTGDYTLELWVYSIIAYSGVICLYNNNSGGYFLQYNTGTGLQTGVAGSSATGTYSTTLTAKTWNHIAVSRASGSSKCFVNGTQVGTTVTDNTNYTQNGAYIGALYTGDQPLTGYISNLRVVKGTAVYTTTFTPSTTPLTAISGTSLLTCQSPTFIDNSTNNFTITANGNSQPTIQNPFGYTSATTNGYTPSTIGGSAYFDGTGDYLSVANSPVWSSLPGDFTIECWFYLNSVSIAQQLIFSQRTSAAGYAPYLIWVTNTTITMYSSSNNGSWNILSGATIASGLTAGQWYHLAFTRSGSTNRIFLNGVQTYTYTNNASFTNNNTFNLGMAPGETNTALNGYITDARLLNGTALYTSNFVPPSAPLTAIQNTSILTNMTSAGIYDASMMNNIETVGDAKLSTAVSKLGSSSMYFDGTDNLSISLSTTLMNIGTGDFTIEGWVYHLDSNTYSGYYFGGANGLVLRRTDANKLEMSHDSVASIVVSTATIPSNQWVYVTGTRSGSTVRIFINGTVAGTATYATSIVGSAAATIGSISNTAGYYMNGYIDDLRITKGYARYTSNFTPPTEAFPTY